MNQCEYNKGILICQQFWNIIKIKNKKWDEKFTENVFIIGYL